MTNTSSQSDGALTSSANARADGPRAFFDRPADGRTSRLVQAVAQGHSVTAVLIATICSFLVLGLLMVALGLLLVHVLEHGSLGVWDRHISMWLDRRRHRTLNRLSGDATNMADTFEVAGVAAVVTIFLLFRRWGRHAFLLVAGLVIELSVFLAANAIVKRPRPSVRHLGGTPSTYSFPSGHTAATVVLWGGIAVIVMVSTKRRWPKIALWALAVVLTVVVGLSRVYRGEHYPTDVMSGFLLGIGSLSAAVFIIRVASAKRSTTSVAPSKPIVTAGRDQRDETRP